MQGFKWIPTAEEKQEMVRLYVTERLTLHEVAARFRLASKDAVAKYLAYAGVATRHSGRKPKHLDKTSVIVKLYTVDHQTLMEISCSLDISRGTITNYLQREGITIRQHKTHGMSETVEYETWCGIKTRCFNANDRGWKFYGGCEMPRTMCAGWRGSFESFFTDIAT